jgi:lycopene cyclase domain-containing protein
VTRFGYLGALAVSLAGLAVLDRRFGLAFWSQPRRAALTVALAVAGFLGWDLIGLGLGIFARGDSPHQTGLLLAPELPIEEVFFLTLLSYVALLVWRGLARAGRPRSRGAARAGPAGAGDRAAPRDPAAGADDHGGGAR